MRLLARSAARIAESGDRPTWPRRSRDHRARDVATPGSRSRSASPRRSTSPRALNWRCTSRPVARMGTSVGSRPAVPRRARGAAHLSAVWSEHPRRTGEAAGLLRTGVPHKDALIAASGPHGVTASTIEAAITNDPDLALLADLANIDKHLKLSRPAPAATPRLSAPRAEFRWARARELATGDGHRPPRSHEGRDGGGPRRARCVASASEAVGLI